MGWAILGASTLLLLLFITALIRHLSDAAESSCTAKSTVALSLFVSLLCMLLLPLDVFVVSFNVDPATGLQRDPSLTATDADGVLILYYVLYAAIGVLGFVLLPFAFFFFEEADDDITTPTQRCCSAIKYTLIFVLVLVVLLVIGAFVKHSSDAPSSGSAWINNLARDTAQQKQMAMCVALLLFLCVFGSPWLA